MGAQWIFATADMFIWACQLYDSQMTFRKECSSVVCTCVLAKHVQYNDASCGTRLQPHDWDSDQFSFKGCGREEPAQQHGAQWRNLDSTPHCMRFHICCPYPCWRQHGGASRMLARQTS